jgi:hypothetical protein
VSFVLRTSLLEPPRRLGAFGIREQPRPSRLPDLVFQRELRPIPAFVSHTLHGLGIPGLP